MKAPCRCGRDKTGRLRVNLDVTLSLASPHAGSTCTVTSDVPARSIASSTASANGAHVYRRPAGDDDRHLGEELAGRVERDPSCARPESRNGCRPLSAFVGIAAWSTRIGIERRKMPTPLHAITSNRYRERRVGHARPARRARASPARGASRRCRPPCAMRRPRKRAPSFARSPARTRRRTVHEQRRRDDADVAGLDRVRRACVASAVIPSRSSSKQEIERKPTMASMPSVSNLSWP